MWMSGGGPYLVERAEGGVDVGTQRRGMAQGRDAADHLAGRRTYEVGIGPFERWQVLLGADLLYVDAMGTGSQDEDRFAFGIENEAVGNSADLDAEGGRGLLRSPRGVGQHPYVARGAEGAQCICYGLHARVQRHVLTLSRCGTVACMGPVRTEVMWQAVVDAVDAAGGANSALNIVDLGGGTGRAAVRLAETGHRVRVVDPSPDALASLHRRAAESDVGESVIGILGDAADLAEHVEAGSADLVLCHGVLEVVDDPGEALAAMARALRPGGFASVVVAGRLAAVLARAIAGDFARAETLYRATAESWDLRNDGPRRYLAEEIASLLEAAGFRIERTHALRVFVDLVPNAMVDSESGARDRLYALERLVKQSADFAPIAAGLQTIACLD